MSCTGDTRGEGWLKKGAGIGEGERMLQQKDRLE